MSSTLGRLLCGFHGGCSHQSSPSSSCNAICNSRMALIVVNRSLPDEMKQTVNRVLRRSVEYAFAHRSASLPFVREHAQEMSEDVMYLHIDLYVNEYSIDLGTEGKRAVAMLFDRAKAAGLIPEAQESLFLEALD